MQALILPGMVVLWDRSVVEIDETLGRYSQRIACEDELVDCGCAPRAQIQPSAGRRNGGCRSYGDAPEASKSADDLEVLHQGRLGKASDAGKALGRHEQRLVSVRHLEKTRTEVGQTLNYSQRSSRAIKAKLECACGYATLG